MRPISRYVDREAFALGFRRHLCLSETFEAHAASTRTPSRPRRSCGIVVHVWFLAQGRRLLRDALARPSVA